MSAEVINKLHIIAKMIELISTIKYNKVITRRGEVKMSLFSEKLKLYIEVSHQTIYQLSKKSRSQPDGDP